MAGLPVRLHPSPPRALLDRLRRQALLYWDVSGMSVDGTLEPQHCESAGADILDAMAAGCIPVVGASGAPPELIRDGETGFLCRSVDDLVRKSAAVLTDQNAFLELCRRAAAEACSAELRAAGDLRRILLAQEQPA